MVAGSEASVEYRAQIYTPAYLLTSYARPVIVRAPNLISPGSSLTIQYSEVSKIERVVLSKLPGVTHSVHMDARQLVLSCRSTATACVTTCQAPPDFTVSPPGAYLLFILSQGVPSKGQVRHVEMLVIGFTPACAGNLLEHVMPYQLSCLLQVSCICHIRPSIGKESKGCC